MTMDCSGWQALVDQLRGVAYRFGLITSASPVHRVEFDTGLTDAEVVAVERRYEFQFPPDLRDFLQTAMPRGPQFPDWRSGDESILRDWLGLPLDGVLFDVEHNGFWLEAWGPRPDSLEAALQTAGELIAAAPRLVPIYGHRMMPDEPHEAGNPVFSVHQTDIIYYGVYLADYLRTEFWLPDREQWLARIRPIRFWDMFVS
jgi:hypothetical protein